MLRETMKGIETVPVLPDDLLDKLIGISLVKETEKMLVEHKVLLAQVK